MHGNPNNNSCIDNRQDEIAILERLMAVVRIAIQQKTNMIGLRQKQRDLVVVIVIAEGNRTVEVDCDVSGVESKARLWLLVGLLGEIGVEGI